MKLRPLTDRQFEAAHLHTHGFGYNKIGQLMGITERTARNYLARAALKDRQYPREWMRWLSDKEKRTYAYYFLPDA